MTKSLPVFPSEVQYDKITFEKTPKKDGPKTYRAKYDGHPFDVVVGKIDVPFGVSDNTKFVKEGDTVKYHLELSLDITNEKAKLFRNFLEKVDQVNYKYISDNSIEMFGKSHLTVDEVRKHKDCSLITISKDKETGQKSVKYSDRFRVKLPIFPDGPKFQVFDKDGTEIVFFNKETGEIDWSWAQKQMKINPIIQSEGILVMPTGAVYTKWKLLALRIMEYNTTTISKDAFRDEETEPVASLTNQVSDLHVEEEDDEEEE